jgi:hypothetical protein
MRFTAPEKLNEKGGLMSFYALEFRKDFNVDEKQKV